MKLNILTQNLHCLVEEDIANKQIILANKIAELDIDIAFLQEVAQTQCNQPIEDFPINDDNYAVKLKDLLAEKGLTYYLQYVPIKESFGIYDEGVAILSKYPLELYNATCISRTTDYANWKKRVVLTCKSNISNKEIFLATTHYGWSDGYEVFENQFDESVKAIEDKDISILAGDFNVIPDSKEYKHIKNSKFIDSFNDTDYFNKPTFRGDELTKDKQVRIDYIMTNKNIKVLDKKILFIDDRVSDHYGVYAKIVL